MSDNQPVNPKGASQSHGAEFETLRIQDESTEGNTKWSEDQLVREGDLPLPAVFGMTSSRVYNERNKNKSRREDTFIDTTDLHTLENVETDGLSELGADDIQVDTKVVNVTTGTAGLLSSGNLVLEDSIQELDRVHGRQSTKTVAAWEPRTTVTKKDPDAGGEDTIDTRQVVANATAWPTATETTLGLSRQQIGEDKFLQSHKVAAALGDTTEENTFGASGCPTTTTTTREATTFVMPATTLAMVNQTLSKSDGHGKTYSVTVLDSGWPTLVSSEEEPTTGMKVTSTKTVLDAAPAFSTTGTGRFMSMVNHTGCGRWTKTVKEIHADILTTTFTEFHSVDYSFPAYLDESNPFWIINLGSNVVVNSVRASSHRFKIPCRFDITYHTTVPVASEVFQFKPVDVVLRANDFTINERKVITDGATLSLRMPVVEEGGTNTLSDEISFEFPASSPTTTAYKVLMADNTEVLIADDASRWKYNLWRRVKVIMPMPDLTQGLDGSLIY